MVGSKRMILLFYLTAIINFALNEFAQAFRSNRDSNSTIIEKDLDHFLMDSLIKNVNQHRDTIKKNAEARLHYSNGHKIVRSRMESEELGTMPEIPNAIIESQSKTTNDKSNMKAILEEDLKDFIHYGRDGMETSISLCIDEEREYVFLIDESDLVEKDDWIEGVKKFVMLLAYALSEGKIKNNTISLVKYGSTAKVVIDKMDLRRDKITEIQLKISEAFNENKINGRSDLGKALKYTREHVLKNGKDYLPITDRSDYNESRTKAKGYHVSLMVITAGHAQDGSAAFDESLILRRNGVQISFVTPTTGNERECRRMAGCVYAIYTYCDHIITHYEYDNILQKVRDSVTALCDEAGRNAVCAEKWSPFTECSVKCGRGVRSATFLGYDEILLPTAGSYGAQGVGCNKVYEHLKFKQQLCYVQCGQVVTNNLKSPPPKGNITSQINLDHPPSPKPAKPEITPNSETVVNENNKEEPVDKQPIIEAQTTVDIHSSDEAQTTVDGHSSDENDEAQSSEEDDEAQSSEEDDDGAQSYEEDDGAQSYEEDDGAQDVIEYTSEHPLVEENHSLQMTNHPLPEVVRRHVEHPLSFHKNHFAHSGFVHHNGTTTVSNSKDGYTEVRTREKSISSQRHSDKKNSFKGNMITISVAIAAIVFIIVVAVIFYILKLRKNKNRHSTDQAGEDDFLIGDGADIKHAESYRVANVDDNVWT